MTDSPRPVRNPQRPLNCWEYFAANSGREELPHGCQQCPVPRATAYDGINAGKNGGRSCWAVQGTRCHGQEPESVAEKSAQCVVCDFFQLVAGDAPPRAKL